MTTRLKSRMLKLASQAIDGHSILEREAREYGDGVHETADGGALLGHFDEHFARLSVVVVTDGEVAFVATDGKLMRDRLPRGR